MVHRQNPMRTVNFTTRRAMRCAALSSEHVQKCMSFPELFMLQAYRPLPAWRQACELQTQDRLESSAGGLSG